MYLSKITAHLHGNDTKMIFLVAPDQESFGVVVEDTTASRPEAASVGGLQEAVTFFEEEVIVDQLLLDFLAHAGQRIEGSLQFTLQARQSAGDFLFHFFVLSFS